MMEFDAAVSIIGKEYRLKCMEVELLARCIFMLMGTEENKTKQLPSTVKKIVEREVGSTI